MNPLRLAAAAAMALASTSPAPAARIPLFSPAAHLFSAWAGSGRRTNRGWGSKNDEARRHGIPKAFRQHAIRHGSSVHELVRMHKQAPAPLLDHGRDRRMARKCA